jgi:hypothetical protein
MSKVARAQDQSEENVDINEECKGLVFPQEMMEELMEVAGVDKVLEVLEVPVSAIVPAVGLVETVGTVLSIIIDINFRDDQGNLLQNLI